MNRLAELTRSDLGPIFVHSPRPPGTCTSMLRPILLFIAAAACGNGYAQAPAPAPAQASSPVGKVAQVQGLVTMSFGSRVAMVQADTPVYDGARLVASSSGNAEVRFEDGCVVRLKPNEWITIDSNDDCKSRLLAVRTLSNLAVAGAQAATQQAIFPLLGIAALTGVVARVQEREITPRPQ